MPSTGPPRKYVAVAEDHPRELDKTELRIQEFPPPAGLSGGRLRVLGYPWYDQPPITVTELPLTFGSYEDATALPRIPGPGLGKVGAIYSGEGELIQASIRGKNSSYWDATPEHLPKSFPQPRREITGRSLFAGHWGPCFGHVLLETLTRFWPDVDYSVYDHLVLYPKRPDKPKFAHKPYIDVLVGGAGPGPRADYLMLTHGGARFERIDIATAPLLIKATADARFLDVFDRIAARLLAEPDPDAPRADRVYLSRSRYKTGRKRSASNETRIEEIFTQHGFTIVHPQELSIPHQVNLMRNAEVIAGCDGSALHMSAFARPGTKLLAIDSRTVPNQFLIDQARQLDAVHVLAIDGELKEHSGTWRIMGQKALLGLDLLLS